METQNKKHQNARSIDEKLKTKSLMFFVSFVSCDLQDFKWLFSKPSGKHIIAPFFKCDFQDFKF